ncbi:MAG: ABC transporter permease [Nanoarchaeota archaeon]|nr:ABC transporter permease [Nanoarchaeota archaeon]
MKILRMLEKDLRLFLRDQRTVLLIILTPILIMLILGNVFSGSSSLESITGVTIAVCNLDKQELDLSIPIFDIAYTTPSSNCESLLKEKVKRGELRGAIIIPSNFSSNIQLGYGSTIKLYIDSSKSQTAIVTSDAMKAYVQELNERIGVSFIEEAWKNLNRLNLRLKYALENMAVAKKTAEDIQVMTQSLLDALNKINTTGIYEAVDGMEERLDQIDKLLNSTESVLAITNNITDYESAVNSSINSLSRITDLLNTSLETDASQLREVYDTVCAIEAPSLPLTMCEEINSTIDDMEASIAQIDSARQTLLNSSSELRTVVLTDTFAEMERYDAALTAGLDQVNQIKKEVNTSQSQLEFVREQVALVEQIKLDTTRELEKTNDIVKNYTQDIIDISNEINQTTLVLDQYTSRDPRSIVSAVTLNEEKVYGDKTYFQFLFPGLLSVILMFITLFIASAAIVSERKSGTMARNFLAPLPIPLFLLQKVLYLLILAVIQLLLMFIIALFFGVRFAFSWPLCLIAMIVSVTFICLGMFIGALSKTENTALLTSLVLGLPMLFLSGLFFPFEIMPEFMKSIGTNLPLTLSTINMERLITYNTAIDYGVVWKLLITSALLFLFTYLLVKRKPMAD